MEETKINSHRWSGWPGAHCMKCGSEDLIELAIGAGYFDPFSEKWDSPEHKEEFTNKECPVSDKQWYDYLVENHSEEKAKLYFPDVIPTE